MNVMKDLWD